MELLQREAQLAMLRNASVLDWYGAARYFQGAPDDPDAMWRFGFNTPTSQAQARVTAAAASLPLVPFALSSLEPAGGNLKVYGQ